MDQLKLQRKKELQASVRFRSPEPVFRASTDKSDSDGACARTTLTGRSGRGNGDEGMWDGAGSTERAPEKKGRGSTGRKTVEAHGKVSVLSCTAARPPISLLLFLSSTQSSLFPPSPLPLLPPSPRLSLSRASSTISQARGKGSVLSHRSSPSSPSFASLVRYRSAGANRYVKAVMLRGSAARAAFSWCPGGGCRYRLVGDGSSNGSEGGGGGALFDALCLGGLVHLGGLLRREGQRLLRQDVLACTE